MENVGREAFFYVGGEYAGPPGKEEMHGAMYVEVMVPKQIKQKYPIVFFHGNGQDGTVWKQTPDNRPGATLVRSRQRPKITCACGVSRSRAYTAARRPVSCRA